MKRIKKIGVIQVSLFSLLFTVLISLVLIIIQLFMEEWIAHPGILFTLSAIYFLLTAIFCLVYNLLAKWMGGIEIYFEESGDQEGGVENK
jgi:hypothetical protein